MANNRDRKAEIKEMSTAASQSRQTQLDEKNVRSLLEEGRALGDRARDELSKLLVVDDQALKLNLR